MNSLQCLWVGLLCAVVTVNCRGLSNIAEEPQSMGPNPPIGFLKDNERTLGIDQAVRSRCPHGFFWFSESNQCFRFLGDFRRNWHEANASCHREGLVLARPYLPVVLRSYLVNRYGSDVEAWINGRGNGNNIVWQNNGDVITSKNPQWWPGMPGTRVSNYWCLLIRARAEFWRDHTEKPYYPTSCNRGLFTLCEWELN